jgi:hypothetical protein
MHVATPNGVAHRAVLSLRQLCVCFSDTSSIHSQFFRRHKNTERNTRRFISKCFLSSREWFHMQKEEGRNVVRGFE